MKAIRMIAEILCCIVLVTGCSHPAQGATKTAETPAAKTPVDAQSDVIGDEPTEAVIGMANPASVHCEEHGGALEMRDSDAGQYGVCVFPDGSECDEWAFFRSECSPGPEADPADITEPVEDWAGVVVSNPEGAQFDDYFQMLDQNGARVGITGSDAIGEQLVALRDTGTIIHVWGVIRRDVPDAYGAQIEVMRLEIE